MNLHLLPVLVAALLATGCEQPFEVVRGSGNVVVQERMVDQFDEIVLSGACALDAQSGVSTQTLEITADDNVLPLITSNVRERVLTIGSTGAYSTVDEVCVKVRAPSIRVLRGSGVVNGKIEDLQEKEFRLDLSGTGKIALAGKADQLHADVSGAGNVDGSRLECRSVHASVSGAGKMRLWVTEKLDATISGVGSIRYKGNPPDVTRKVGGTGTIEPE